MIILEPPHYSGGEQVINISRQRSDPSRRSFTPNSEAERGEHPSRPSSVHSYRVQTRQHKKSPSASSSGSNVRMAGSASPLHKYHRRAGSTSSTRVVRQSRPSQNSTTPARPTHVRSSSTASSIHSLQSSRPGSFYEASESENQRTNSPLPTTTRRSLDDSSSKRTVMIAQKRQTPFLGPIASGYNSSTRSLAWKKAWGIEPPGWSSRSTQPPVEVLAILPGGDQSASIRDVFTGRQSISMGDEDDWVDEEDDVTLFASGFGQPSNSSKTSNDAPLTLLPLREYPTEILKDIHEIPPPRVTKTIGQAVVPSLDSHLCKAICPCPETTQFSTHLLSLRPQRSNVWRGDNCLHVLGPPSRLQSKRRMKERNNLFPVVNSLSAIIKIIHVLYVSNIFIIPSLSFHIVRSLNPSVSLAIIPVMW